MSESLRVRGRRKSGFLKKKYTFKCKMSSKYVQNEPENDLNTIHMHSSLIHLGQGQGQGGLRAHSGKTGCEWVPVPFQGTIHTHSHFHSHLGQFSPVHLAVCFWKAGVAETTGKMLNKIFQYGQKYEDT